MKKRVLVFVKPDGVKRKLVGKVISRFEEAGLKIVAIKMAKASRKLAEKQYPKTEEQIVGMGNKPLRAALERGETVREVEKIFGTKDPRKIGLILRKWLIEFLISSPVVVMVLEGENAVENARKIVGYTDPERAERGTIRGDFGQDSLYNANKERRTTRNIVHVSGSDKEAEREIKLWFKKKEFFDY